MTVIGSCTNKSNILSIGGRTAISSDTITNAWTITSFCVYVSDSTVSPFDVILRIFRSDGTNWNRVGDSGVKSCVIGSNSGLSCNIPVLPGDRVGICVISTGWTYIKYDSGSGMLFYDGNVTSLAISSWWNGNPNYGAGLSMSVTMDETTYPNVYVDTANGNDINAGDSFVSGHSKKTLQAGYTILSAGGTIHAASGTYSKTGITFNKSWKLSPEDPNSTGSKVVKIGN